MGSTVVNSYLQWLHCRIVAVISGVLDSLKIRDRSGWLKLQAVLSGAVLSRVHCSGATTPPKRENSFLLTVINLRFSVGPFEVTGADSNTIYGVWGGHHRAVLMPKPNCKMKGFQIRFLCNTKCSSGKKAYL